MKINYACGKRVLDGYVNIDAVANPGAPRPPEVIHAMTFDAAGALMRRVPLGDCVAFELMSIHFLEHVHAWEAPAMLAEWRRLLKPGGALVLELPDLLKCASNLLALVGAGGKPVQQMGLWGIYGDDTLRDPYMCHKYGWWPDSLRALLAAGGFERIREEPTQWHGAGRKNRDMRLTAVRAC